MLTWAKISTVHFAMKVLHRRFQWESIFAKLWSQHLPTMIAQGSYKFFTDRKDERSSPFGEHFMIAGAWRLSNCSFVLTCCSNADSVKFRNQFVSIHKRICSYLDWKKLSELYGCLDIYSHGMIYVRKTKFLCSENKIAHSDMKHYLHAENEIL